MMGSSNQIEGMILSMTFKGMFGFTTIIFIGKIVVAVATAVDRKIASVDAWLNNKVGPITDAFDFIRGISEWLGR